MDILSHGLWTAALARAINLKLKPKRKLNVLLAGFFGFLPDLLAFTPAFLYIILELAFDTNNGIIPHPANLEPPLRNTIPIFQLTDILYKLSHSIFPFIIIFSIFSLILKRPIYELSGWLIHILIDIPTHTYELYPTPFLWPFSTIIFGGITWVSPYFIMLNYSALIVIYYFLYFKKQKLYLK